jgi:GDP-L-galactose phosphorylase
MKSVSKMQCYAEKQALGEVSQELLDTQVNPAVWEISGHIVLKQRNDYENASEALAWRLLAEVSLSEVRFEEVKAYIFDAAGLVQSHVEDETEDAVYAPVTVAPPAVAEGCLVHQ